jgi:hypothetical protein
MRDPEDYEPDDLDDYEYLQDLYAGRGGQSGRVNEEGWNG